MSANSQDPVPGNVFSSDSAGQDQLAASILQAARPSGSKAPTYRVGVVTAWDASTWTLSATISGSTTTVAGIPHMDGTPVAVNDTVLLVDYGPTYLSLGSWQAARRASSGAAGFFTGSEGAIVGTAPTAGTPIVTRSGTYAGTTSAGSALTIPYSIAFPNGVVSVVAGPGDNANSLGFFQLPLASVTLSNFVVFAWRAGATTSIASLPVRANYIATGW